MYKGQSPSRQWLMGKPPVYPPINKNTKQQQFRKLNQQTSVDDNIINNSNKPQESFVDITERSKSLDELLNDPKINSNDETTDKTKQNEPLSTKTKRLSRSYDSNIDLTINGENSHLAAKPSNNLELADNKSDNTSNSDDKHQQYLSKSCQNLDEDDCCSNSSTSDNKDTKSTINTSKGSLSSLPSNSSLSKRKKNFMDKCVNKVRSFIKK